MSEEEKSRGVTGNQHSQSPYGTFQGVANYFPYPPPPPPQPLLQPVIGLPRPFPPPAFAHGYQTVTGYAVAEVRPIREDRLPCCGLGMGWFLFMIGFFFGGIPWYLGTFILLFVRTDYREKAGYVACALASILAFIAITLGVTKGALVWGA